MNKRNNSIDMHGALQSLCADRASVGALPGHFLKLAPHHGGAKRRMREAALDIYVTLGLGVVAIALAIIGIATT